MHEAFTVKVDRGGLGRRFYARMGVCLVMATLHASEARADDPAPPPAAAEPSPPAPIADLPADPAPAAQTRPPRERSTVELARLDAGVFYIRGQKMFGAGTTAAYEVLVGQVDLDVARFPHERLGFEIHVNGGPIGFDENAQVEIGLSGAGLVAPFRWKGRAPGSFVLGIGGAFEFGRPVWLDPGFHGAPFALARFRIFPNDSVGIQTTYRYVPITTGDVWLQEHDVDFGVSTGLLQIGLRARVDEARGGDPARLYRSIGGGLFAGLVVF